MEPAANIIALLGGPAKVSKEIGIHRTRVSNWKRPREAGGTGGVIPRKYYETLVAMAQREGVPLSYADFFASPAQETAA